MERALNRKYGGRDITPGGHFKDMLTEESKNQIYDNTAEEKRDDVDGLAMLINGYDGFRKKATEAMIADGCARDILQCYLLSCHGCSSLSESKPIAVIVLPFCCVNVNPENAGPHLREPTIVEYHLPIWATRTLQ